jgi:hypothetical protein
MELKFKDFVCYPCPTETVRDRFDMFWYRDTPYRAGEKAVREKKAKVGELRVVEELIGYGMRLDECIKKAIKYLIQSKDEVMDLKEYLHEYRILEQEIKEIINIDE